LRRPRDALLEHRRQRFNRRAGEHDAAAVEQDASLADRLHVPRVVGDEQQRAAAIDVSAHVLRAFSLEGDVPDGEYFVDEEDVRIQIGG
jgi:hypothetical protein